VKVQESLGNFRNMAGRQEIYEKGGYTIISDCYNAGPESMAAALKVLGRQSGRKIAVLGDMLELGTCTTAEHYKVGRLAAEQADHLLAYGPNGERMEKGALTGGMTEGRARAYTDRRELVAALKRLARPGDVLLFKGSRGMHMELAMEQFFSDET
jgi:UDP-N-acetylmuramoyl-tripeptide--D-alanyl-D-alanine ligase